MYSKKILNKYLKKKLMKIFIISRNTYIFQKMIF